MQPIEYRDFATYYGKQSGPVIVTDLQLRTIYLNPAAAENNVIPLTEDCIRKCADPRARERIRRCRTYGKKQHFLLTVGQGFTRRFSVTVEREGEYLVFSLTLRPDKEQQALQQQLEPLTAGFEYIMSSSLHQLLGISELMQLSEDGTARALGENTRRQVLRAMRITRQIELLNKEHPCRVYDFHKLLRTVTDELEPFLQKHFNVELIYLQEKAEGAAVKCNAALMQTILMGLFAGILQHEQGNILLRYTETEKEVALILHSSNNNAPEQPREIAPSPASLGINVTEELIRRQQGKLLIRTSQGHQMYYLTLPRSQPDSAIKENMQQHLQQSVPEAELAFADLL